MLVGFAAVAFYLSDYSDRRYLWGPEGYNSFADAEQALPHGTFSIYLMSRSDTWFEITFHLGLVVAVMFTIFGGRFLTALHAVFLWSLYLRNQDLLEGGDNLIRIVLPLMIFTRSDAYLSPGAKKRRAALRAESRTPSVRTLMHNVFVTAILCQISLLYFVAGTVKARAPIWTNGTAMYYISHSHEFSMTPLFSNAMNDAYISWIVCYFTIISEVLVPFIVWTRLSYLRKSIIVMLEGMHLGIMAFMGLVPFGLIMLGADSLVLADGDYEKTARALHAIRRYVHNPGKRTGGISSSEIEKQTVEAGSE
jgi:hypothetical protein